MAGEVRVIVSVVAYRSGMRTAGLRDRMCVALLLRSRGGSSGGVVCEWVLHPTPSWEMIVYGMKRGTDAGLSAGLHCAAKAL